MGSKNQKNVVLVLVLAAVLATNLFVLTPLGIYLGNSGEFITPLLKLLAWWALPSIVTLLVLVVVGIVIPASWHQPYIVLLANLSLLIWFQSSLLVWDYGLLDGRNIEWASFVWRGWIDGTIWALVLTVGMVFSRRLFPIVAQAAVLLFIVQSIQACYGIYNVYDQQMPEAKVNQAGVLTNIANFSAQSNVLHIVLDGFQSDFFDELIHHQQIGAGYRHDLSGFTFYRQTLGIFPYTRFAVPAYLSGQIYKNDQPKNEFIGQAIAGKSIFNVASAAGMELDIASHEYWAPLYAMANHTNSYVIPEGGHGTEFEFRLVNTAKLIDLALFRVAPHFLKQKIYDNQRWLLTPLVMDTEYLQFHYFSHTQFLNEVTAGMSVDRSSPTYKYLHVMNTHNPMVVDEDCHYAGRALQTNRTTLLIQSKCTLDTVVALLERMKQLGVYENTLIILHGDHGGWVAHRDYQPKQVNKYEDIPFWAVSLGSPLLAIKPPGVGGQIVISDRLASLTDIADTVADIMGWSQKFQGESLIGTAGVEPRSRYFYNYYWQRDAWATDYTGPVQEYEVSGNHYETAWVPRRVFKPPQ
ncbi:MAG: sulfatase-like hydrolase/transferase [Immundisolibacteraceae bacterium]|nr:sulfatase-like hydrolase/transferase [Immundisolibacteraceae bacterium]